MVNVTVDDTEGEDDDDGVEEEKAGIKVKEIIVVAFIIGIWLYSLYRYLSLTQWKYRVKLWSRQFACSTHC